MPRKQVVVKREVLPDPKFQSMLLARFVNVLMRKGKKSVAESICYKALDRVREKSKEDPIVVFKKAIDNLKPSLEVKSRRVGGNLKEHPSRFVKINGSKIFSVANFGDRYAAASERFLPLKLGL